MTNHGEAHGREVHGLSADADRSWRLETVLRAGGLQPRQPPSGVESHSNDTWLIDDRAIGALVLRICYRGDVDRLLREATIGRAVPPEVGYAGVLGSGETSVGGHRLTWSLSRRLWGSTLLEAWPVLPEAGRRRAACSTARALRVFHMWRPAERLIAGLSWPASDALNAPERVIGATMHPLPIGRVRRLIGELSGIEGVDRSLVMAVSQTIERLRHLAPGFDDPSIANLVHGDLQLSNVWWNDHGEAGLIDLEWLRFAPAWVDLARLRDNAEADATEGLHAHAELLGWLREDYPELFDVDRLDDRLRFLCLAFQVRQALIWPTPSPAEELAADHPLRMLERLV